MADEKRNDAKPDARPRLVKLVRDRVGDFLGETGGVSYRAPAQGRGGNQHRELLKSKLLGEAGEYILSDDPSELADVLEVLRALAKLHGMTFGDVLLEADTKRAERGGFDGAICMWVTTTAPSTHEGEHASD